MVMSRTARVRYRVKDGNGRVISGTKGVGRQGRGTSLVLGSNDKDKSQQSDVQYFSGAQLTKCSAMTLFMHDCSWKEHTL
jgi:hypothetical protein